MKKLNFSILVALIFSFSMLNAQNDHSDKNHDNHDYGSDARFSFLGYGGIGYAVVDNDNQPNYNLDINTADFLLHYRIGKRYGIATGIGFDQLTGTGFNAGGNFYHERGTLRIPLLLSVNYNLSHKVRLIANVGVYGKTIVRDEYSFVGGTIDDVYEGWNFGLQTGIGLSYNFNQKVSLGIMFTTQGDFNRIDSDPNKGIADAQKITGVNTIGLLFAINL
ncbi:MAG: outer membrane beta-barrel protein [Kordia sp.]|uniref:hypothetical protein n=1 Tax=Kordia sp. TaxID=1965332 RepID=UPI0038591E05